MNILITGEKSYIGTSFEKWVKQSNPTWNIDTISVRNQSWKEKCFKNYDAIVHVAGIAHVKESRENNDLYYKVNRDLTVDIAKKAKEDGVNHFIFISTMSVYGLNGKIGEEVIIDRNTPCKPINAYGKSKLEAEELLSVLDNDEFCVSIIRPPMVFGPSCKGNYDKLSKFVRKYRFFPKIKNKRSMIYIDNLSSELNKIIESRSKGIFYPQNTEYVSTNQLIEEIAKSRNIKIYQSPTLGIIVAILLSRLSIINKIFGNLVYSKEISHNKDSEIVKGLKTMVERCEFLGEV